MNMKKRIAAAEDQALTAKEAVILWMQEAREFDSLGDYGLWLQDQPPEVWPLVRMPRQVVEAVRRKNPGKPDDVLRDHFYRAQRDLLFLFFTYSQLNLCAIQEEEAIWPRLELLAERLRGLVSRKQHHDQKRIENLTFPKDLSGLRAKKPQKTKTALTGDPDLDEDLAAWTQDEKDLRVRILSLKEAEELLSGRYLGAQEILHPRSHRRLQASLDMLSGLRSLYREAVLAGPPPDQESLIRWVIENWQAKKGQAPEPNPAADPAMAEDREPDPEVTLEVQELVRYLVTGAKAEALSALGNSEGSVRLMGEWVRSRAGGGV